MSEKEERRKKEQCSESNKYASFTVLRLQIIEFPIESVRPLWG